ncbi:MAG: glycogen synthase GlgA [Inquilinus sp.]|nr:glycogen synthase GlgA [Inquilinus sp.]
MRVLHVAAELYPLVKTGGLADVLGALPGALAGLGVETRVLVPGYPAVMRALEGAVPVAREGDLFGGGARLLAGRAAGVPVPLYVLDCPSLFDRPGNPYLDADGRDWPDNHRRFGSLSWFAARLGQGADPAWRPHVVHAHDWQAGLAPAYLELAGGERPGTVLTVHNLAYQGLFPRETLVELRLPPWAFTYDRLEFHGKLGFLKGGLAYADRISTVSRTYAREIQGAEQGCGLDQLLRHRAGDLVGIVNGIDTGVWDPSTDPHLPAPYDAAAPGPKALSKAALQKAFGLEAVPEAPVFGVVSRLNVHKGLDLALAALPGLLRKGGQFVLLGNGDADLERGFAAVAGRHPREVGVRIGYDEALSHLIQGGSDVILVPSRSEPCGLTQLYALRYGALPLVRRAGGLADTVVDATAAAQRRGTATGFVFDAASPRALAAAIGRACRLYADRAAWAKVRKTAMTRDFGWPAAAREYLALYEGLLG